MQAPLSESPSAGGPGLSVGGPFCVVDASAPFDTAPTRLKGFFVGVNNVDIVVRPGDCLEPYDPLSLPPESCLDPAPDLEAWRCVICQYPDKVIIQSGAVPTLSALGTAVLLGGLLTAVLYELRKRQPKAAA